MTINENGIPNTTSIDIATLVPKKNHVAKKITDRLCPHAQTTVPKNKKPGCKEPLEYVVEKSCSTVISQKTYFINNPGTGTHLSKIVGTTNPYTTSLHQPISEPTVQIILCLSRLVLATQQSVTTKNKNNKNLLMSRITIAFTSRIIG